MTAAVTERKKPVRVGSGKSCTLRAMAHIMGKRLFYADLVVRGLLVRHLVLPGGLAGTAATARFLADEVSPDTYINVMGQYRPAYRAHVCATEVLPLGRRPSSTEIADAFRQARAAGLHRFDARD